MLALAAMPNLSTAFPAAVFVGVTSVAFMTTSTTMLQLRADPVMRGRVLALQAMVFLGSTPIGGPILGAVCERYGARAGLIVGGIACLLAGAYGVAAGRRLLRRELPSDQPLVTTGADLQPA
jgi:MFS family permease